MKVSEGKSIFLENLTKILNEDLHHNTISWSNDGKAFIIYHIKDFTDKVLPLFFKHSNFASFHRQLNLYGFVRDKKILTGKAFKHPLFEKNRPDLVESIHKKQKNSLFPVVFSQSNPAIKKMIICNTIKELSVNHAKISQKLQTMTDKISELGDFQNFLKEENKNMTGDVDKAKDILIYFVNWIKNRAKRFNVYGMAKESPVRKNFEVEEISDVAWNESLTYHGVDEF